MEYAYYGGEYLPYSEMKIPLTDRSIYFGDAVYDVCVGRGGGIYQFDRHFERLKQNCEFMKIEAKDLEETLKEVIKRLISLSSLEEYVIYIQVSRNANKRRHNFKENDRRTLLVTATEFQHGSGCEPIKLISIPDIRHRLCNIKTTDLLPAALALSEAMERGGDEAVFLLDGYVTECSRSNVAILKGGKIYTHPKDEKILPGIMRENLIQKAKLIGIGTKEEPFTYRDMLEADEIFVTSTTKFLKRASSVNGVPSGMKSQEVYSALSKLLLKDFLDS